MCVFPRWSLGELIRMPSNVIQERKTRLPLPHRDFLHWKVNFSGTRPSPVSRRTREERSLPSPSDRFRSDRTHKIGGKGRLISIGDFDNLAVRIPTRFANRECYNTCVPVCACKMHAARGDKQAPSSPIKGSSAANLLAPLDGSDLLQGSHGAPGAPGPLHSRARDSSWLNARRYIASLWILYYTAIVYCILHYSHREKIPRVFHSVWDFNPLRLTSKYFRNFLLTKHIVVQNAFPNSRNSISRAHIRTLGMMNARTNEFINL